jgi:nucleoside-specific outer membrane channel protein Tsx
VFKSLFGWEQRISKGWQKAYLIGIGREFKIGFVQMMSMIMYDLNYQNNDLNVHPWVFRLGVRFTKEPW